MKRSTHPARRNSKSFAGALFAVAFTLLAISAGADRSVSEAASARAPGRASSNPVAGDAQLALFGVLTPAAATINVNSTAEGTGGGACTLSAAIQAANTNLQVDGCAAGSSLGTDTIMLPAGRYILTTVNNNLDGVGATGLTAITSDVIILGAGSATTIIERDPAATARFRLMAISNQSAGSLVLNDVTMRGGRASNDFPGLGGALFTRSRPAMLNRVVFEDNTAPFGGAVYGPTFTVNDCTFTNNRATAGGGGAIGADAITVLRSFFTANTATRNGGAIEVGGGGVNSITDSSFSNNAATGASSSGGALLTGGTTTITGTSFTGNTANAESGAIAAGGTVNMSDSVIRNNSAGEIGAIGAGSFIGGASPLTLNIDRCDISNNAAIGRSVGGIFALGGNVNISNSTISANTAIMDGGGIRAQNANLTLTNVTIDGNSTNGNGGGIWVNNGDETKIVTLNNVTLTGNNAGGSGGGLHRSQGETRFKNTIIARNISGSNSAPDIAGFFTSLGYNLVGIKDGASFTNTAGDRTGTAAAPINPLLGPLLANGGPTLTRALFGGSPAIDAGNPSVPGSGGDSCAAMDQRGTARPQDGDGNGSQICDIGAVENVFPPPTPQWQPVVLTAQQIAEIKAWTVGGRTYVYVKLQFPDAGYRIVSAGQFTRAGNDFTVDASVERFTGPSIQSIVTTALIYDLGPLTDGTYNFNFKTSGTLAKTLQFTVSSATPPPNPIDDARLFVKQQYRDFLNREADPAGENFWTDNITKCSDPARRPPGQTELQCTLRQRETTSGAFFLSPEFQFTGYYVYRMFQGGLGRQPKLSEFTPDAQFVGAGIIVNGQLSGAKIEQNKAAFAEHFVNCSDAAKARCAEFKAIYDGLNNQQYVDKLFQTTGVNASAADRAALVNGLNANPATETRASVLQKVVDGIVVISEGNQQFTTSYGQTFYNSEFNRAFVLLEYFGYMKRDPDDAGYAFWLDKLNQFAGNFVNAEMVLAFISSPEYRARFGQP